MAPSPLTLVVLAAGLGTRYGGLKQLAPVGPHREDFARAEEHALVGYALRDTLSAHGGVSRAIAETDPQGYLSRLTEVVDIARRGPPRPSSPDARLRGTP